MGLGSGLTVEELRSQTKTRQVTTQGSRTRSAPYVTCESFIKTTDALEVCIPALGRGGDRSETGPRPCVSLNVRHLGHLVVSGFC